MISFEVQTPPIPLFRPGGDIRREMQDGTLRAMSRALGIIHRRARVNLSGRFLNVRTGRLISSLRSLIRIEGADVVGYEGTDVWYGALHDRGTTHLMIPRTTRPLTVQGRTVFAATPGVTRRRPWLTTAARESEREVVDAFRREMRRVLVGHALAAERA